MTADRKLRVAIAGAGYFARFHYDGWSRIPGVEIVAAADQELVKVDGYAKEFGVLRTFQSVSAMLSNVEADILDIATPPPTHAGFVGLGLQHVQTVICQKPFCTTLDEARATAKLAGDHPERIVVHENFRFEPWYRVVKRMLDERALGDLYQITFRMRPGDGQGPEAYLSRQPYFRQMPRFLMRETGIHFIDTFRFLCGEIDSVYADLRRLNPMIAGEDAGIVIFHFASGVRGVFDANRLADHPADDRRKTMGELAIEGSLGTLRLDGFGRLWLRSHGSNDEQSVPFEWQDRGYGGDCVHLFQRHIVQFLRGHGALENSSMAYLRNLEIEAAVYRSCDEARLLRIAIDSSNDV
jgi:predicted dehydrogenase